MANIRFGVTGNNEYSDHRQLNNIGKYEHTVIDQFIDELEHARANELSLGDRLDKIEQVNEEQDTILSGIDGIRKDLDDLGIEVEEIKKILQSGNADLDELKKLVAKHTVDITALNDLIVKINKELSDRIADVTNEVKDARLSTDGILYPTLKDRLDAIQYSGGGGSGGGSGVSAVRYFMEHVTLKSDDHKTVTLTKGSYVVGSNELDVFLNGMRQALGDDYRELSPTSIELTTLTSKDDIVSLRLRDRSNPLWTNTIISESIDLIPNVVEYTLGTPFNTTTMFLEVYLNGKLLVEGVDYSKLGFTKIKLLFTVNSGDVLLCQIIDTNDKGIKQLIEHLNGVSGKTTYSLRTFKVSVGDPNLEVYRDGTLLRLGADYAIINTTDILFTAPIYTGERLTFCIENTQGKAVPMSTFKELEEKVANLRVLEHKNKTFSVSDWTKENSVSYTFVFPFSQHVTQRNKIVVEVYEIVGEMYYKVGCDVGINRHGDVILQSLVPFDGNVVIL